MPDLNGLLFDTGKSPLGPVSARSATASTRRTLAPAATARQRFASPRLGQRLATAIIGGESRRDRARVDGEASGRAVPHALPQPRFVDIRKVGQQLAKKLTSGAFGGGVLFRGAPSTTSFTIARAGSMIQLRLFPGANGKGRSGRK